MKATGIVRRIDELGRVVIPKEIRRTLRIREGDPLEIFTDRDGEIILKKYSPIGELGDFSGEYVESLFQSTGHIAVICDKDTVISAAGPGKKELMDKPISAGLEKVISERKKGIFTKEAGNVSIVADEKENEKYAAQTVVPIIAEGSPIGAVILLTKEPDIKMSEPELKVAETAAKFLGMQMEQ